MRELFDRFAARVSKLAGSPLASALAFATIVAWAATGPVFSYSDTWQLAINTGTTIVTFLMVFLIQSTQNRDTEALQLKLAELIRANRHAHDRLATIEDATQAERQREQHKLRQECQPGQECN